MSASARRAGTLRRLMAGVLLGALAALQPEPSAARSTRVAISAGASETPGSFDAYVDTRRLSEPYDLSGVVLYVDCTRHDGLVARHGVTFTDRMLGRGHVYHKRLDLPAECAGWVRLASAHAPLAVGKADGPGTEVSIQQGRRSDATYRLPNPLPAPAQTAPSDATIFNMGPPRHTIVNWHHVRNAASYTVEVLRETEGQWVATFLFPGVTTPYLQFIFPGAQWGAWRVWAVRGDGTVGEASPWGTFYWVH